MNFYELLVDRHSGKTIPAMSITMNDLSVKEYTYSELLKLVDETSEKMKEIGIKETFKVAMAFQNSIEWFVNYIALTKLEAIPVLTDFTLPKVEFNELITNTDVNVVLTTKTGFEKIKETKVPCFDVFNNLQPLNNKTDFGTVDNELKEKEVGTILFSSGTTAIPTGIMQTTAHLIDTSENCLITNKIMNQDQRFLGLLPNNHIYGLLMNVYAPLLSGSNVRILESLSPDVLMASFKGYKPTVFASVPKVCELLKAKILAQVEDQGKTKLLNTFLPICYNLRTKFGINLGKKLFHAVHDGLGGAIDIFPTAGAPISEDTAKFFIGLGFRFMSTYGATETNIPTFGARGEDLVIDSVGKPYPNIEYKFSSDGEILIKDPYCMLGYYKNKEATDRIFTEDGYIKTGDIGYIDAKDNLKITGRVKDNIILSNGKKIFPENLEKEFSKLKTVCEEFAICGRTIQDMSFSEIHLFVAKPKTKEEAEQIISEINQDLPTYMQCNNVHFVDTIPKTNLDKIKRYALIESLGDPNANTPQNMTFDEEIIYFCLKMANVNKDYKTISRDTKIFSDLGLDSLSTVTFLIELENRYKIDLKDATKLPKETTIQEFLDYIKKAPKKKK